MSFSKPRLLTLAFGCFTIAIAAAPRARAATCGDTDCGKGFTCVTTPIATPEPAKAPCPINTPCLVTDPAVPAVDAGAPTTASFCVAASCTNDGDCGAGMVCHTSTEACGETVGACAAGTKCDPLPSTACAAGAGISTCVYKSQLPCNVDADCGDGFTCMPSVSGACSGGSGTGTASAGGAATGSGGAASSEPNMPVPAADGGSAPHDMCTTTTSFPGYCQAKLVACTVASDCPGAWTCTAQSVGVGVATSGSTTAVDAGAPTNTTSNMAAIAPGEPAPTSTTHPTTMMVCTPPGGGYASPGEVTNTGDKTSTSTGAAGTHGGGTTGTDPQAASTGSANGASAPSAGCALGGRPGPTSLGLTALALLGIAFARRRR